MGIFSKLFTWWDGATIGTAMFSAFNGEQVGTDAQGNKYYRSKKKGSGGREPFDRERREKQLAAMLRAGHRLDTAREIVDAASEEAAENWVAEIEEEA